MVSKWAIGYNLLTNGVFLGVITTPKLLLTSWDIQVVLQILCPKN